MATVIVPAHNEGAVIGRLLAQLMRGAEPNELEVLVVSNGSTDTTASIARSFRGVNVLELARASKHLALQAGDAAVTGFPRIYVDADVEISIDGIRALVAALEQPGVLAVAPERKLLADQSSWPVRAYYRVWDELPTVRQGLFGRGVLAVNAAGFDRIAKRPNVIGDDLFLHQQFSSTERRIIPTAISTVRAPRRLPDLIRRRTRAAQGNAELGAVDRGRPSSTAASFRGLAEVAARRPGLWPSVAVFVSVTLTARWQARRRRSSADAAVWLRDESSRS